MVSKNSKFIKKNEKWDDILTPKASFLNLFFFINLVKYKDLILMFVKRDFVTFYKQTILGPIWYIIQPLVNTLVFTVIFGNLAKLPTDGLPPFIFYMAGNVIWSYFTACFNLTSNIFVTNAGLFGKVYFPRLTVPIANIIISLLQFTIQFSIFTIFLIYFIYSGSDINLSYNILLLPLILLYVAFVSLGFGMLVSAITAKYRDLSFAMSFLIQLWMYITPIVYPLSLVPDKYKIYVALNPMTTAVESFKYIFLGQSSITINHLLLGFLITFIVLIFGIITFTRVEKNFMDTV